MLNVSPCLINAMMSVEMVYAIIWAHMSYTYGLGNTVDNKVQFSMDDIPDNVRKRDLGHLSR